ncbi:hypothetical protein XENOCAPTIV_013009 [Xenoophorus captivus]|uniref:Uncharacterized protein n=1 Tax=Xenoophorus captivus TaxID=1517983 RepID=A0ABV0SAC6_9TELE
MITGFFPLKKLRRNGKYFLFAAVLLVGALAVYHEMVAARAWSSDVGLNPDSSNWRRAMLNQKVRRDGWPDWVEDSTAWMSSFTPQTWKPEVCVFVCVYMSAHYLHASVFHLTSFEL